jgi:hypothetical protein
MKGSNPCYRRERAFWGILHGFACAVQNSPISANGAWLLVISLSSLFAPICTQIPVLSLPQRYRVFIRFQAKQS